MKAAQKLANNLALTIATAIVEDDLSSWDVLPVLTMIEARCKHNIIEDMEDMVNEELEVGSEIEAIQVLLQQLQSKGGSSGGSSLN